jgi:hypothetical protein
VLHNASDLTVLTTMLQLSNNQKKRSDNKHLLLAIVSHKMKLNENEIGKSERCRLLVFSALKHTFYKFIGKACHKKILSSYEMFTHEEP